MVHLKHSGELNAERIRAVQSRNFLQATRKQPIRTTIRVVVEEKGKLRFLTPRGKWDTNGKFNA